MPTAKIDSNLHALSDYSAARLTIGAYYAIRDSEHEGESEQLLEENAFRSHLPNGYRVIQAVSARTYQFVKYDPDYTLPTGQITGLAPGPDAAKAAVSAEVLRKRRGRVPHSRDFGPLPGDMIEPDAMEKRRRSVGNTATVETTAITSLDSLD